jgi:hypothetical protein
MSMDNLEKAWRVFLYFFIILLFLAPFGFIKVLEIIKYIVTHLHWTP